MPKKRSHLLTMLKLHVKPIHPWTIGEPPEFHHSSWLVKRRLSRTFKSFWQTAAPFAKLELENLVDSSICSMQRRHWQAVWTICFKAKQWEMQSTNTFAQSCAPSKESSLGPSQSWACRTHENIKRFFLFADSLGILVICNLVTRCSKSKERVVGLYRAFSNRPRYYQFGYRM